MRPVAKLLLVLALFSFIGTLGGVAIASFTGHKLEKMRMIRGEIPGATFVVGKVTSTRALPYGQCELSIDVEGRPTKQWADGDACARFTVGSEATLARLPGEPGLELQGGTYVSDGNMAFDRSLLVLERIAAVILGVLSVVLGVAAYFFRR